MDRFSLCIELPTKNESANIKFMIENIRKHCSFEVIVSDEHSSDGTAKTAKSMGVKVFPRERPGYGRGLQESLRNAKKLGHTHLLVIDCDRTYPISYIKKMASLARKGCDLVNASRRLSDINSINRLPNLFHTVLMKMLYFTPISDVNSGMKMMDIEKYLDRIKADGNDSTVQTVIIAAKKKFKVCQVLIPYDDRHGDSSRGVSKIKYRDGFIITWRIIKDRFM